MIYSAEEYLALAQTAPKALNLARLQKQGHPVPAFLVVANEYDWRVVADSINKQLSAQRYAVRFAALDEDNQTQSNAGRYTTKLNVTRADLASALIEVVESSVVKLSHNKAYVVIVQEYVVAEFSGVAFTRHPHGHTAWRIEYTAGSGGVVGGEEVIGVNGDVATIIKELPTALQKLVNLMPRIEREFGWPQDIEWCSVGDEIFIIQSRPITSINTQTWAAILYLSAELADLHHYHYKSGSGVETFLEPKPLDYSLLQYLYSTNGAVAEAYTRLGVRYLKTNQFRLFGNRLYIDVEKEQQAIFPAYRLRKPGDYKINWRSPADVFRTVYNHAQLSRPVSASVVETALSELCVLLATPAPVADSLDEALLILVRQYAVIFLCNHLVQQKEFINTVSQMPTLLARFRQHYGKYPSDLVSGLAVGNSLAIGDISKFAVTEVREFEAVVLNDVVRELTRWQSVRLRKMMADCVLSSCVMQAVPAELINFITLSELLKTDVQIGQLQERKNYYDSQDSLTMPEIVSSWMSENPNEPLVISPGRANGVLRRVKDIADVSVAGDNKVILLVDTLTPDCVQYFNQVVGVVCCSGGLLSHAAIVAREQKIPVLRIESFSFDYVGRTVSIFDGVIMVNYTAHGREILIAFDPVIEEMNYPDASMRGNFLEYS